MESLLINAVQVFLSTWIKLRLNILVRMVERMRKNENEMRILCKWNVASSLLLLISFFGILSKEFIYSVYNSWWSFLYDMLSICLFFLSLNLTLLISCVCRRQCVNVVSFDVHLKCHEFSTVWYKFVAVWGCLMFLKVLAVKPNTNAVVNEIVKYPERK